LRKKRGKGQHTAKVGQGKKKKTYKGGNKKTGPTKQSNVTGLGGKIFPAFLSREKKPEKGKLWGAWGGKEVTHSSGKKPKIIKKKRGGLLSHFGTTTCAQLPPDEKRMPNRHKLVSSKLEQRWASKKTKKNRGGRSIMLKTLPSTSHHVRGEKKHQGCREKRTPPTKRQNRGTDASPSPEPAQCPRTTKKPPHQGTPDPPSKRSGLMELTMKKKKTERKD